VNLAAIRTQARRLLETAAGHPVSVSQPQVIKDTARSLVLRCRVEGTPAGGSSVIIRQVRADAARGFSDWAGLEFLSALPEARGLVPRFIAGDAAARLFVMEDLGSGRNLQDILEHEGTAALRTALGSLARQMARLHRAALGKEHDFEELRRSLPEADELGRQTESRVWLHGRAKVTNWFTAVNRVPPRGLDASLEHVAAVYEQADGFLAFTHGDPAPSNNHFSGSGTRLLDFEYCAYRHALYDLSAWNVLCPLPADCVAGMVAEFRAELAPGFPAALDDACFAEAWACLCAYRALAVLSWIPPAILAENRSWVGTWTAREAVLVILSRLEAVTATVPALEAVNGGAGILLHELRLRWPAYGDAESLLPFRAAASS
jgi:hypothetical protein